MNTDEPRSILVCFAVNDPDNGCHTGYAEAFDFGDSLHIECTDTRPMVCRREKNGKLRIGRRQFAILGYGTWIGNWCWDGAWVTLEVASGIANHIQRTGKYECDMGEVSFFDAWHENKPIFFENMLEGVE